jgi:hypothetical protein
MKVFKISPRKHDIARRPKILEAKNSLRNLWELPSTAPVSFTKDPLLKAIGISLERFPDAIIYMSRASRSDTIQRVVEIGAPWRQFETNFLGNITENSISQIVDSKAPAIILASAGTKTGSSDDIRVIRNTVYGTQKIKDIYIHMVCDDVGSILPFNHEKSNVISLDNIDSISCESESFVTQGTVGVLAGEVVDDAEVNTEFVNSIIDRHSLETTAIATFALTNAMFEVLFKNGIPAYLLKGSNVILVKAPERIRTSYGLELHDEWTCLRIPRNTEAGFIVNVINDIVDYYAKN